MLAPRTLGFHVPAGVKAGQMWGLWKWAVGVQATWGLTLGPGWVGTLGASRRPGMAGTAGPRTPEGQAATLRASFSAQSLRKHLHYGGVLPSQEMGTHNAQVSAGISEGLAVDGAGGSTRFP